MSYFKRLVKAAEKNKTFRFLRNCISYISFAPLIDILAGIGLFRGPLPTISMSRYRALLERVVKEREKAIKI